MTPKSTIPKGYTHTEKSKFTTSSKPQNLPKTSASATTIDPKIITSKATPPQTLTKVPQKISSLQNLTHKPSLPPRRSTIKSSAPSRKKQSNEERNEYEPDPIADTEELGPEEKYWNNNYSSAIQNLFPRKHYSLPNNINEDDVLEVGFLDWEEEEAQSELAGMREDKVELLREKKRKLQKQKRKLK
eukprot:Phypoly_transcript_06079.p2 GENE.Phypoly_transcript_06079~~Phypoly_transcript_06079.p2  ORF type:complete len:187 (+),score=39.98 Phypoly_transcript_06079:1147-1707(+)